MKLTLSERTVVCRPIGRLDVTSAVALRDVLLGDPEPGTEVVLDPSAVTASTRPASPPGSAPYG